MTTPPDGGRSSESASLATSGWSIDVVARAVAIGSVALCAGAGAGFLVSHEPPPHHRPSARESASAAPSASASAATAPEAPPRPRAGDAELALLAPLREGGALGGFEVTEIDPVSKTGQLVLRCRKGSTVARLYVALRANADAGPEPPATAGRYAVFYAIQDDARAEGDALARALAKILEANAAVPAPKGLAPFAPE